MEHNLLLHFSDDTSIIECGCDEAGRGSLAGPVFAAAVILPEGFSNPLLDDSKKLSKKQREKLRTIIENEARAWAVAQVSAEEIDSINILQASIKAMHLAIEKIEASGHTPGLILVDGNRFRKYRNIPHCCIVKGDGKYMSIAAASILAKTHRDEFISLAAKQYPGYGWERNMAYPTREHREAIARLGTTPLHRKSFRLTEEPTLFGMAASQTSDQKDQQL